MRRLIFALALLSVPAFAQTKSSLTASVTSVHSATLSWSPSADGGTVNVYRAPSGGSFSQIATGVAAAGPFTDSTITVGSFTYYVTAVVNGAESAPSNQITLTVLPSPPQSLTGSAK